MASWLIEAFMRPFVGQENAVKVAETVADVGGGLMQATGISAGLNAVAQMMPASSTGLAQGSIPLPPGSSVGEADIARVTGYNAYAPAMTPVLAARGQGAGRGGVGTA